ncbi:MAG: hypothetical protein Q9201_004174 [Fulgogasparrea decipioides]
MDDIPPSYEAAVRRDHWTIICEYVESSDDLCTACRAKPEVAQAELYDGPHPGWLRDVLLKLPNLQSLVVSQIPFFDHASLLALRTHSNAPSVDDRPQPSYALRLLIATQCTNTTQRSLAGALTVFPHLVFLDLSRTLGARDAVVLSKLRHMPSLQILKLSGIQLRDSDMGTLADSIGICVRSLDVRDNFLTDNSVRALLHSCFKVEDGPSIAGGTRQRSLSGAAEEDWPSGILKPDPAVLDEFRDESFDERYLKRLTHGLVSRIPSEDQAHTGITHLYVANNQLSVEGISSLVKSTILHVLDAGAVDTTWLFHRSALSSSSPLMPDLQTPRFGLPGAEKLTPILAKYASKNLTSLRVGHTVVTKWASLKTEEPEPDACELSADAARHEAEAAIPTYELPDNRSELFELAGDPVHFVLSPAVGNKPEDQESRASPQIYRKSIYAPELVTDLNQASEDDAPVLTATGLSPIAQAINGVQSPRTKGLDPKNNETARSRSSSPDLSLSIIARERQEMRSIQYSKPHGLLPSMLPHLRSLTLTDVPCYDETGQVIDALIRFIRYCASEAEFAKLQVDLESRNWINSQYHYPKPTRKAVEEIFALRRITLEISPPNVSSPSSLLLPSSTRSPQTPRFNYRTLSSTEDADSEALWAAQENDFSFFGDNKECGLPSIEPGSGIPQSSISEKMTFASDKVEAPTSSSASQRPANAGRGGDVVQELIKFRKDRKTAYGNAVKLGQRSVEGYWPGEVKVVRTQGGKSATVDYYGNLFEKGYIYR